MPACNSGSGDNQRRTTPIVDCVKPSATPSAPTKQALSLVGSRESCDDITAYHCERRSYRPGLATGVGQESFCVNIAGLGERCNSATFRNFDTSGVVRTSENAERFEPGQAYNYEEANCYHGGFKAGDAFAIRGDGATLGEAHAATRQLCLEAAAR